MAQACGIHKPKKNGPHNSCTAVTMATVTTIQHVLDAAKAAGKQVRCILLTANAVVCACRSAAGCVMRFLVSFCRQVDPVSVAFALGFYAGSRRAELKQGSKEHLVCSLVFISVIVDRNHGPSHDIRLLLSQWPPR